VTIMRYYDEQTQEEVGRAFNVTRGQISNLEKSALAELRGKLAA
jgi:DNA-directed RNA polymerase specialized sigma subunit